MRIQLGVFVLVAFLSATSCSSKKDGGGGGTASGGSAEKPVEVEKPMQCPPGNVVQDGKCVAVVTPEKVKAVVAQQTRLDDLAKFLDKVDVAAAPIELLNAFRKLEEWKKLTEGNDKLKMIDNVVAELDNAVKTLRTFKASLGEASGRLGNLKVELDRLMTETGAAQKLAEVRTKVSAQIRTTMEPLANQVVDTIKNALAPLMTKLEEVQAILEITCASLKLGGGGDKAKTLCAEAKQAFTVGLTWLNDFKDRPAKLYEELTKELEAQLEQLIDAESKKLIDAAQVKVNEALKLPAGSATK